MSEKIVITTEYRKDRITTLVDGRVISEIPNAYWHGLPPILKVKFETPPWKEDQHDQHHHASA